MWLETETAVQILARSGLSKRESEVLNWVAQGKTNRKIGSILEISPRTVSKHLEHIFYKLGVESRTAAMDYLLQKLHENQATTTSTERAEVTCNQESPNSPWARRGRA